MISLNFLFLCNQIVHISRLHFFKSTSIIFLLSPAVFDRQNSAIWEEVAREVYNLTTEMENYFWHQIQGESTNCKMKCHYSQQRHKRTGHGDHSGICFDYIMH